YRGQRVGQVVQGVAEQRDGARPPGDQRLDQRGGPEPGQRDPQRTDALAARRKGRVHLVGGVMRVRRETVPPTVPAPVVVVMVMVVVVVVVMVVVVVTGRGHAGHHARSARVSEGQPRVPVGSPTRTALHGRRRTCRRTSHRARTTSSHGPVCSARSYPSNRPHSRAVTTTSRSRQRPSPSRATVTSATRPTYSPERSYAGWPIRSAVVSTRSSLGMAAPRDPGDQVLAQPVLQF